ncbi:hypothetical protein ACIRRA_10730 [Nocardia sp. NPDC101769]|uniref:hypothetical protein n=1 Tax=Nocardia sp. NPDC101769 TaxID=3364333 RepID=UPI00380C5DB8
MPSIRHEVPLQLLRHRPEVAPRIARNVLVERIAGKVATPVETGHPDFVFRARTYWPGMLPAITTVAEADQWPELALLSAPGHLGDTERRRVLAMALEAMQHLEPDLRVHYHDYISKCVPSRYRKEWEELVAIAIENYHWESDFAREHQAIGRAEALAESVLRILERRGLSIDAAVRARIVGCSDPDLLAHWLDRTLEVDSAEQIFD